MKFTNTKNANANAGIKFLGYGLAGAGKTYAIRTCDEPALIISAESGLLSLSDVSVDAVTIESFDDVDKVYDYLANSEESQKYKWICIDSLSEVAETLLVSELARNKDGRKAYMEVSARTQALVRKFRDLPRNIYMTCKMERQKDEFSGGILCYPSLPGSKLGQQIPYLFDIVAAMRVEKDAEGVLKRMLQTSSDAKYYAKDRSGKLSQFEQPNLAAIRAKVLGSGE